MPPRRPRRRTTTSSKRRRVKPTASSLPMHQRIQAVLNDKALDAWTKHERAGTLLGQSFDADPNVAVRALQQLYHRNQTATEKARGESLGANGVGFDREDGPKLSALCRKLESDAKLTMRELHTVLRYANKYRVQMVKTFPKKVLESIFVTTASEEAKGGDEEGDEEDSGDYLIKSSDDEGDDDDDDDEDDDEDDEGEDDEEEKEEEEEEEGEKKEVVGDKDMASAEEAEDGDDEVRIIEPTPAKESSLPAPCAADGVAVTEFGVRGHMQFSNDLAHLYDLNIASIPQPVFAQTIYKKLQHVPDLTCSDVHCKLFFDFKKAPVAASVGKYIIILERNAWRTCAIQKVFHMQNSTAVEVRHHDGSVCIYALLSTLPAYIV